MILSALRHADGHLTAGGIFERVRLDYPFVDISTVYRTLNVLKELRLVSETDMGSGDTSYEWVRQASRHHHLICRRCGTVNSIEHQLFEDLGAQILAQSGFQPDVEHFAVFGTCAPCQEQGAGSLNGAAAREVA
jgi:Fur family ferric uptake transcriptional regulator